MDNSGKSTYAIFLIIGVVIFSLLKLAIAQVAPNPGHSVNQIGSGTFGEVGDYIFPPGSRIGIGTTSPLFQLDQYAAGMDLLLRLQGENPRITLDSLNPIITKRWNIDQSAFDSTGRLRIFHENKDGSGGVEALTILSSGRIGIGITNPQSNLHVDVPSSASPIGAMSIDVQSFVTGANALDSYFFRVRDVGAGPSTPFYIRGDGKVGIGTTTPASELDVIGKIQASGDICITGGNCLSSGGGFWAASGSNIFSTNPGNVLIGAGGTGKLTVGTIDPVYEIDGKKYATYVADTAGGVKIETSGVVYVRDGLYQIDFDEQEKGSDLWLFWQVSNKNVEDIVAILTPSFDGRVWYEKVPSENKIVIKSSNNGEVSFRFTAPRHDYKEWDNEIKE